MTHSDTRPVRTTSLKLRAAIALSVFFMAALLVFWLVHRQDRITLPNYERIQNGMTLTEVERLLGGPQGEYATRPTVYWQQWGGKSEREGRSGASKHQWRGNKGLIDVELDEQQKVVGKHFASGHEWGSEPPLLVRMFRQILWDLGIVSRVRE
jgi:hypothetical protein